MVLGRLRLWALTLGALCLTACSGSSPDRTQPSTSLGSLAAPSTLPKVVAAAGEYQLRAGVEYVPTYPNRGCSAWQDSLHLVPEPGGMAYAMFAFNLSTFTGDRTLHSSLTAGREATFIGLANQAADRWDWHSLAQLDALDLSALDDYLDAHGYLTAAVVTTEPTILEWVCCGTTNQPGPPQVLHISPTTAGAGEAVRIDADVAGTRPLTYTWEVVQGDADLDDASSAAPTVTFGHAPESTLRLTVENAEGTVEIEQPIVSLPDGSWLHTLGGWQQDEFTCVVNTPDGNILAGGGSGPGMFMASYDQAGALLWQRYYECFIPKWDEPEAADIMAHCPLAITFGPDGSIYVATKTVVRYADTIDLIEPFMFVLKLAPNGETVWGQVVPEVRTTSALEFRDGLLRMYADGHLFHINPNDGAQGLHVRVWSAERFLAAAQGCFNASGELLVTGSTLVNSTFLPVALKLDPAGTLQWSRMYNMGGMTNPEQVRIAAAPDGRLTLVGRDMVAQNMFLLGLDADGGVIYSYGWTDPRLELSDVRVDNAGNIVVCGGDQYDLELASHFEVLWFSRMGALMHGWQMQGLDDTAALSALPQPDGSVVIGGAADNAGVQLEEHKPTMVDVPVEETDVPTEVTDEENPPQDDDMLMFTSDFVVDRGGGYRDGMVLKLVNLQ
jgi:hypothetical protein